MRDESTLPTVLRKNLPPNLDKIRKGNYTKEDDDYPIHEYLKETDIRVDENGSDVIDFLREKSILVTGATGYLGKLLVEKLLRCCKDIDTIYIIVRTKKGKDPESRVNEYLDNWIFIRLSEIYPNFKDKVVGIAGDFEEEGLGISEESRKILTEKVHIIYHLAATVRFDEKLKKAVKVNIKGTQEIVKLAKECKKLDVLTHMSTAFSNCHNSYIKEQFYTPLIDPYKLMDITDRLSSDIVDKITPGLVGDSPNTYAFTKQIAEDIVRAESNGIPTCIQRPAIVLATATEPIRSWVDNLYGPVGILEAAALGLFHIMMGNANGRCSVVPADYTVNNCIVASYKTAKDRNTKQVQIFNFASLDSNPLLWKNMQYCSIHGNKIASTMVLGKGFFRFTKCWYWFRCLYFLLHTVPGYIIDFIAVRLGKEARLTKTYEKIDSFLSLLSHFTLNEWKFESTNTEALWQSLNEHDKKIFSFDMGTLDWRHYFEVYLVAIREFLMLEFLDNLEEGRKYLKWVTLLTNAVFYTILVASVYFCLNTMFFFIPIIMISIRMFYYFQDQY